MKVTDLLIYGLATWRLASLFVQEDGPFDVFVKLRELAGIEHDENKEPYIIPDNFFAGILSCVWCCSMWAALLWGVIYLLFPVWSLKIAMVFAFSTIAIVIDKYLS